MLLVDDKTTNGNSKSQLKLILRKVKEGDSSYFYYSGHGIPVPKQGNALDALLTGVKPNVVGGQDNEWFRVASLYQTLQKPKAQVFAFVDSCFTGFLSSSLCMVVTRSTWD